jgi:hypothetical protein
VLAVSVAELATVAALVTVAFVRNITPVNVEPEIPVHV